jgi:very-short-patch-repair endonuclease
LRKNMTEPEKKLWYWFLRKINNWEIKLPLIKGDAESRGIRVLRQRPIDNFIVDFYIPKLKLVIEIDWESHFDEQWKDYDVERTQILEWLWLKVIRFTNEEVMNNFDWVCKNLEREFYIYN